MTNPVQKTFPNFMNMYFAVKDQPVKGLVLESVAAPLLIDRFFAGPEFVFRPVALMSWALVEEMEQEVSR